MKCKNCNWPNRPGEKNCIKCGAPLTDNAPAPQIPSGHNPTVVNTPAPAAPFQSPRPQVRPAPAPKPQSIPQPIPQPLPQQQPQPQPLPQSQPKPQPQPRPIAPANPNVCPRCNYPLRPGMAECPNCFYQLTPAARPAPRPAAPAPAPAPGRPANPAVAPIPQGAPLPQGVTAPAANHRPTVIGIPEVNAPATPEPRQGTPEAPRYRGTVNVYTAAAPETTPKFTLSPVQKVNEATAPADLKFEGQEAILNRANTDPDNLSITSRQQASISKRDGKWVITDLSDQQTTFVHPAKSGQELHEGDIILLGNRLFIFHE